MPEIGYKKGEAFFSSVGDKNKLCTGRQRYVDFAENIKGSLEAGKFADPVIWHDSPYTVADPADLLELKVDLTLVGGKVVFERSS